MLVEWLSGWSWNPHFILLKVGSAGMCNCELMVTDLDDVHQGKK